MFLSKDPRPLALRISCPPPPTPLPLQKLEIICQKKNLSQTGVRTGDKQFPYVYKLYTKLAAPVVRESMNFASTSADNRHKVI
jgi:hypothetical protein